MSKPISFGFGKPKVSVLSKTSVAPSAKRKIVDGRSTVHASDNEDEEEPKHESVTGFSSEGVILNRPVQKEIELVIKNSGNGDWRTRGKNLLPAEVQAARNGDVVMVEKDEVSKASGLRFADHNDVPKDGWVSTTVQLVPAVPAEPAKELTDDEAALAALLDDGSGRHKSTAVIQQSGNTRLKGQDETADFRADVATRPDSSTLEDYAAMPVEEFGLAMLRGMGQKRRAKGEVIDLNGDKKEENPRKQRKQEGFLGIGAKAAPGAEIELGAWGKADMRKNNKGEGFFTPLMRVNETTGERITEEELQKRVKESRGAKDEGDWRDRRDRNLERSGRDKDRRNGSQKRLTNGDDYRDQMNDFSRHSSSSRRSRDDKEHENSRSRREKDDRDYDSSRSRRDRSRSKERRRRDDDDRHDSRPRDKHRDRQRDENRYDSISYHQNRHRNRDEDRRHR